MRRYRLWHLGLALIVGAAGGAAFGLHRGRWEAHRYMAAGGPPTARMVERFGRRLHLTEDQKQKLAPILDRAKQRMVVLHGDTAPRVEAIRRESAAAIERILTPDQVAPFRAMQKKWDDRRKAWDAPAPVH